MNAILTDTQVREWATILARKADDALGEGDITFWHCYNDLTAEVHCTADVVTNEDKTTGTSWWYENAKCDVEVYSEIADYTTEELVMLSSRLQKMLN